MKGHPVKVFANGIYGPAVIHAAYLDERINSVEITHSVKTWKEYIEKPMQWDMYSNVLYGALKYYDLPDLIRLSNRPIRLQIKNRIHLHCRSILNVLKAQQSAPAVDGIYGLSISFPGNQHASG